MLDWLRDKTEEGRARLALERSARSRKQGAALLDEGRLQDAAQAFAAAVDFAPADGAARVSLGFALVSLDRCDLALPHLQEATRLTPQDADAWYLLAQCQERGGSASDAAGSLRTALELRQDFEFAARDLARVLIKSHCFEEAGRVLEDALRKHSRVADLHFYQGHLHRHLGQLAKAAESYVVAARLERDRAELHMALAEAQAAVGDVDGAVRSYARTIALQPDLAQAHINLSDALNSRGNAKEAAEAARNAIALDPHLAAAHNNLGVALASSSQDAAALRSFRRAVELAPDVPDFLTNCGAALHRQGEIGEAISCYQRAMALDPTLLHVRSNLLFALTFAHDRSPAEYIEQARAFGREATAWARLDERPPGAPRDPARPLRVGLVSGDFLSHPVGFFLESVLANIDRTQIELVAYSTQPRTDALTERLKGSFVQWRTLWRVSDAEAARQIRDDGIDLLVDLAGHSKHNRLGLFAWRAAPVQASWLGYFASTGVQEIDYLIADPVSAPPALSSQFSETLWYLPDTRLCFTAPAGPAEYLPGPSPAMQNGYVTFGCFQHPTKYNEQVMHAWARILTLVPGSRLRLQTNLQGLDPNRLPSRLSACGIALERVTLVPSVSRNDYLLAHRQVDLLLDTFPYPGGTTTCEALWMGVPTVTLAGSSLLSRQGASLMSCAGLADWVAEDVDGYVDRAVAFASDVAALDALRQQLRARVLASPVFDAPRFAKDLTDAFHGMCRDASRG